MTISAKVYFRPGIQVRRVTIDQSVPLETFVTELRNLYESSPLFPGGEYQTQLLYLDEENDWILVNTEKEWKDGIRSFTNKKEHEKKDEDSVLRIRFYIIRKKGDNSGSTSSTKPSIGWRKVDTPKKRSVSRTKRSALTSVLAEHNHENQNCEKLSDILSNVLGSVCVHFSQDTTPDNLKELSQKIVTSVTKPDESTEPDAENITTAKEERDELHDVSTDYEVALNALEDMGFKNREHNLMELKKHKGNLITTVPSLLKLSMRP
jgi:hypothetical protein